MTNCCNFQIDLLEKTQRERSVYHVINLDWPDDFWVPTGCEFDEFFDGLIEREEK